MDGIRFAELLDYNEEETQHWKQWFAANAAAADLPVDIAGAGTARQLLLHIFFVELHFANAVLGLAPADFPTLRAQIEDSKTKSVDDLFAISEEATCKYREYFAKATPQDLSTTLDVSSRLKFKPSKRKLVTQALTHSIRHWAQLSTFFRQQGLKQDWVHDFLMSKAME